MRATIAPSSPIDSFLRNLHIEKKLLTVVPCLDEIVKVLDEVFDDNNRNCCISSLTYRFRYCCAVGKLVLYDILLARKPLLIA